MRVEDSGYVEAQKLLAKYQTDLGTVRTRLRMEQASVSALEQAKQQIESLLAASGNGYWLDRNQTIGQIQSIIYQLHSVEVGTTAYAEAQQLLRSAQNKLNQITQPASRSNLANWTAAILCII